MSENRTTRHLVQNTERLREQLDAYSGRHLRIALILLILSVLSVSGYGFALFCKYRLFPQDQLFWEQCSQVILAVSIFVNLLSFWNNWRFPRDLQQEIRSGLAAGRAHLHSLEPGPLSLDAATLKHRLQSLEKRARKLGMRRVRQTQTAQASQAL